MNDLMTLILSLSKEEADDFLAFAKAKNQRSDVKNIQLFQLLRNGARKDLDLKIYGKPNRNAMHALTNRLKENLIDFTATRSLASDAAEDLQLLKQLLAARLFLEQNQYSLGFKTLQKAIYKAQLLEQYALLQECYHTQVQYVHLDPKSTLDAVIEAYTRNQELYETETKLVMAYAILQRELANHPADIFEVIRQQLLKFNITIDKHLSFKSLFQIMTIATDAATLKSDYAGVAIFMNHIFEIVESKKHLVARHLYYYSEILYLMSGTYFRNADFSNSQLALERLEAVLASGKGKHTAPFEERVQILKALNLNYTGDFEKAIEVVNQIKKPSSRAALVQTTFLFQQEHWQQARRKINEFYHSDAFYEKKEGLLWVLQKNLLEVLIYMELHQPHLVESKMRSFKKRFRSRLLLIKEDRVMAFMNLLRIYFDQPSRITEKSFKDKVEGAFVWKTAGREDIFVMSFYAYLKAKMDQTTIYTATLQLVNQKNGAGMKE